MAATSANTGSRFGFSIPGKSEVKIALDTIIEPPEAEKEAKFREFYAEVKQIEKEDSVLTSKQQIERLLRPGATYFNLNPFEVLQVPADALIEEVRRKYKRLSILVHPDKNPGDQERSQKAFEAVNNAYKKLEDETERKKCLEVIEEAKERVAQMMEEKRKKLKKEPGKPAVIDEDQPDKYERSVYVMTCKLFADLERLRQTEEKKKMEERKRKAEEDEDTEAAEFFRKEWDKNFEESREDRVQSWQVFNHKNSKKKKKPQALFKPPKPRPEQRNGP